MSEERKIPWIIKYRPKTLAEYVNQEEAKNKVLEWLKKWPNVSKKAILLYGPPGCGKTTLVEVVARELGYEVIETNASDFRRKTDIERISIRASTTKSIFGSSMKIILLDEVDGIEAKADEGGIEAIKQLVENTSVPVIMTANNPYEQSLRPLRDIVEMIQLKKLSKYDIKKVLQNICAKEKIVCHDDALEYIIEKSEGDLRAAINDLQAVGEGYGEVTLERVKALLRPRDKEKDPFETLRTIFSANYAWQARAVLNQTQLDYEQLKLWLDENIPIQYSDTEDLERAYDRLSKADVYLGRIVKTGEWDLLTYATDLMTAGVALAAKNNPKDKYRWQKYSFPQRITLATKTKESRDLMNDIAKLLAQSLHISTSTAVNEVIPYLRALFQVNPKYAVRIALGLGLSEKMVEFLAGSDKAAIVQLYKELKKALQEGSKKVEQSVNVEQKAGEEKVSKKQKGAAKDLLSFKK